MDFLTPEDQAERLSRNDGQQLPLHVAQQPTRGQISSTSRRKPVTALTLFRLLLPNTTAVNNSSYAYSRRRITSNAIGVVRLRVEQSSSGAAPRCIVCCCTSTGRRTPLYTSTRTTLHKQLVSILTSYLYVQ